MENISDYEMEALKAGLREVIRLAGNSVADAIMYTHSFMWALVHLVPSEQFYILLAYKVELIQNFKPEDVKNVQS